MHRKVVHRCIKKRNRKYYEKRGLLQGLKTQKDINLIKKPHKKPVAPLDPMNKSFKCGYCQSRFSNTNLLGIHRKVVHRSKKKRIRNKKSVA